MALRNGLAALRITAAVAVLALASVGAVGTWRWVSAWINPPPAPPPEIARDVTPQPRVEVELPTKAAPITAEQAERFGVDRAPRAANGAGTATAEAPSLATGAAGHLLPGAIARSLGSPPWVLAEVQAGPGPRGDTFDALCYVPTAGEVAEIRVVWTSPPPTLAEAAGCAAAQGASATADAAKAAGEAIARRLGHELRVALRGGPGYGTGGPGLLGLLSIEGRTKRGRSYAVDGVAWLSADPAFAVGATWGMERRLLGGD